MKTQKISEFVVLNGVQGTLCEFGTDPYPEASEKNYEEYDFSLKADFSTPRLLLEAASGCAPLRKFLTSIYGSQRRGLLQDLKALKGSSIPDGDSKRTLLEAKLKAMPYRGKTKVADWIVQLDTESFEEVQVEVDKWAQAEPEDNEQDGISAALNFFRDLDSSTLELLGVSIVEGEFPGSSYFAAELDISVDEANKIALRENIPVRFHEEQ